MCVCVCVCVCVPARKDVRGKRLRMRACATLLAIFVSEFCVFV